MCSVMFLVLKGRNDVAMGVSPWSAWHHALKVPKGRHEVAKYNDRSCRPFRTAATYSDKSMGFCPWLQHAAASRLIAMLRNSILQAIQSYRSKNFGDPRSMKSLRRRNRIRQTTSNYQPARGQYYRSTANSRYHSLLPLSNCLPHPS